MNAVTDIDLRILDPNGTWRVATQEEADAEWEAFEGEHCKQAEADFYDDALNAYYETHGRMPSDYWKA